MILHKKELLEKLKGSYPNYKKESSMEAVFNNTEFCEQLEAAIIDGVTNGKEVIFSLNPFAQKLKLDVPAQYLFLERFRQMMRERGYLKIKRLGGMADDGNHNLLVEVCVFV